jgi:V/A-type H+-transporting ATPase subunit K
MDLVGIASLGATMGIMGGVVGSALGISKAAPTGLSVIAEEPGYFKFVMLLSSLPMTQTFYGFIFTFYALMIILPGISATITPFQAYAMLGIGFMVLLAELFSAYMQGVVCMAGILELPKTKGKIASTTMILAAYEEIFGILGMVFGIVLLIMVSGL